MQSRSVHTTHPPTKAQRRVRATHPTAVSLPLDACSGKLRATPWPTPLPLTQAPAQGSWYVGVVVVVSTRPPSHGR